MAITNFPNKGDDKKISLRNSEEPQFDYEFAKRLKESQPKIWKAGGNIRGNEAFMLWGRARKGEDTEAIREWIKEREAWIKRHYRDGQQFKKGTEPNLSNVAGVVAQIKWGTIGNLGERGMKDVILELTKKLEGKKEKNAISDRIKKALETKVKDHNAEIKELDLDWNAKTTLAELTEVFERGVGAYKTNPGSVRPGVTGPDQWGLARVNSFLFALKKGRYQGGKHDTDLLPKNHPIRKDMDEKKAKEIQERHIQKIEETDDAFIIYYGKAHDDEEEMTPMETEDSYHDDEEHKEMEEERSVEFEKRMTKSNIQMREEGSNTVTGYAAVFNKLSENLGGFRETINKRAFEGRLEDDVRFLINHDGMPLGRTTAGTLRLSVDETGLKYEVDLPDTPTANELRVALERKEITQSSFQFTVEEDTWEERNGEMRREILKVGRLLDVAAVTFPAYPDATIALRKMENFKATQKEKEQYKAEEKDLHFRSIRELKIKLLNRN